MSTAIITGSAGLVGSAAALRFATAGMHIVGIDNDMRQQFFGEEASTAWQRDRLTAALRESYVHHEIDIRNAEAIDRIFASHSRDIDLVIHAAAQPSHDWAASDPRTDFGVNATGTINLLEAARQNSPDATFIFLSTNKVYGDRPNSLPLVDDGTRFEIEAGHTYERGIREDMPIDTCLHSVFGASKVAADVMVQEYGRYFEMPTACFRGGTLTGAAHSATKLHGFLAYLMRCVMTKTPYEVIGYQGKQVRDAIHSDDLIEAFAAFHASPRCSAVYNIGGGRFSNVSVLEAISKCEAIAGDPLDWSYTDANRVGDHKWWIGDNGSFSRDYPEWRQEYDVDRILQEIFNANRERWTP